MGVADFKPARVLPQGQTGLAGVEPVVVGHPARAPMADQGLQPPTDIGVAGTAEVHHPLVVIAYQQIHTPALHIYLQCAQRLHAVHEQQQASFAAHLAQTVHVDAVAGLALHQIHGDGAGVFVAQGHQLLRRDGTVFRHGVPHLQPLILPLLPGKAVANPAAIHRHHVVLGAVLHGLRHHGEQLRGALAKGDAIRCAVDHPPQRDL